MTDPNLLAGRYRLLERRDHTGTSWRARDEALHRDVTISEVRLPPPGPHRDWLMGQIRAAADLRHPGVVALHDVIPASDRMWLVLESVEGRSLMQTVRAEGPLPAGRAAEVGLKVLDALTAAQGRGLRLTATPDTILLTPDGLVVLTGVAAPAPADDLRDLGAALFTAVEGHLPGTGSGIRTADGTPLASPETGFTGSGPLAPLLDGMLAENPAHRPDATSVRLALESLAPRPASSRRKPLLIAGLAVASALVVTGGVLWSMSEAPSPPPAPAASAAPYVDPGPFSKKPSVCKLFTPQQLAQLEVEKEPGEWGDGCVWGPMNSDDPASLQRHLSLNPKLYSGADEAARAFAARFAHGTRSAGSQNGRTQTAPRKAAGLGNEAFWGEVITDAYSVTVVVRINNVIVDLQYQRNAGEPTQEISRRALTAAGWAVEALTRAS
ncbi:hypothetical protein HS041_10410 [Planomonospora sp. ID67723]|uniref:hypothetical protein n=1 Tax=Planomonospora sp. ID67723 TaxID=2738134 RepID=UPI0018C3E336|nr:hypothetical protein [Planomonospora sp. ID67723]MBG0828180.1 hypothetical protein [Planomonospora sp. ID67723]